MLLPLALLLDMAKDMVALLDHLGLEKANAMGWSDGGIIGLELALSHPARVKRVVALGANARPDGHHHLPAEPEKATADSFGPEKRKAYEEVAPDPSRWLAHVKALFAMWRTQPNWSDERLGSIRTPVLLGTGDRDEYIRLDHALALHRAIPGSQLLVMPGARHSSSAQDLDLVEHVAARFLKAP
ncbi:MAG: alpha/beta fold hydrolase [Myxococcales bacterium]|nr:alpha/beta fold hydrolase [Myxococcales bacterium]